MLEVRLYKRFPGFTLDVSFATEAPLVALLGPSGSGKTLTLRAIAGLLAPDAGLVRIDDAVLFDSERGIDLPPQERRVGYVPQHYALFPHLSVQANIGFGLQRAGREAKAEIARLIDLMGLNGLERRRPRQLSGGQQQRVALARALAVRPRLLLLDEPFSALDTTARAEMRAHVLAMQQAFQCTVLLVTHDPADAAIAAAAFSFRNGRLGEA